MYSLSPRLDPRVPPGGAVVVRRHLAARCRRDRRPRAGSARETVPLRRALRVREGSIGVDRRRPHLVQAQATLARRPHPSRARPRRLSPPARRHRPAATPSPGSLCRRVGARQQTPREAPRSRAHRSRSPSRPELHAFRIGSQLASPTTAVGRPVAPRVRRRRPPLSVRRAPQRRRVRRRSLDRARPPPHPPPCRQDRDLGSRSRHTTDRVRVGRFRVAADRQPVGRGSSALASPKRRRAYIRGRSPTPRHHLVSCAPSSPHRTPACSSLPPLVLCLEARAPRCGTV